MIADAITFTGERLDRAADRREPQLALLPLAALRSSEPLLLGLDAVGPVFAADVQAADGNEQTALLACRGDSRSHDG